MTVRFKRDKRKDTILLIVQHLNERLQRTISSCNESEWDDRAKMVTEDHDDFEHLYPHLMDLKVRAKMILRKQPTDCQTVVNYLMTESESDPDLLKFAESYIKDQESLALKQEGKGDIVERNRAQGHAEHYSHIHSKLKKYFSTIRHSTITKAWVRQLENELLSDVDLSRTTAHAYLKRTKALYNKMIMRLDLPDKRPFDQQLFKVTRRAYEQPKKRLNNENLRKLAELELEGSFEIARDMWFCLFELGGCDLTDFYFLKEKDLAQNRLSLSRDKVRGSSMNLLATPRVMDFLNKHAGTNGFLLPWRKDRQGYHTWRNNMRRQLALISDRYGIYTASGGKLGWKVARHTFASRAKDLNIEGDLLRELMGHRRNEIDNYYKEPFPAPVRDAAQMKIADLTPKEDEDQNDGSIA